MVGKNRSCSRPYGVKFEFASSSPFKWFFPLPWALFSYACALWRFLELSILSFWLYIYFTIQISPKWRNSALREWSRPWSFIPSKLMKSLCFNRTFSVYLWILFFFLKQKQQINLEIKNYSKLEGMFPLSLWKRPKVYCIPSCYQRKEKVLFSVINY